MSSRARAMQRQMVREDIRKEARVMDALWDDVFGDVECFPLVADGVDLQTAHMMLAYREGGDPRMVDAVIVQTKGEDE